MRDGTHLPELDRWLEDATEGIWHGAKQRICDEIQVHYAEAVDAELALGRNLADAHRVALESLGDAKKARNVFHKTYLTEREAKELTSRQRLERKRNLPFRLGRWAVAGFVGLCACGVYASLITGYSESRHRNLTFSLAMFVNCFILWWLCPRLERQRAWRRAFVWSYVAPLMTVPAVWAAWVNLGLSAGREQVGQVWTEMAGVHIVLLLLLGLYAFMSHGAPILRKLGKNTDLYDSLLDADGGRDG